MVACAVCGRPIPPKESTSAHPPHTDAELAETAGAVQAAGDLLAALYLMHLALERLRDATEAAA